MWIVLYLFYEVWRHCICLRGFCCHTNTMEVKSFDSLGTIKVAVPTDLHCIDVASDVSVPVIPNLWRQLYLTGANNCGNGVFTSRKSEDVWSCSVMKQNVHQVLYCLDTVLLTLSIHRPKLVCMSLHKKIWPLIQNTVQLFIRSLSLLVWIWIRGVHD